MCIYMYLQIYTCIYVYVCIKYVLPAQVKYFTLQARSFVEIKCDRSSSIHRSIPAPPSLALLLSFPPLEANLHMRNSRDEQQAQEILKILWQNVNEARVQAMNSGHQRGQ